jgi:NodT family efflux transporter outer membrane factor (OMF) lipoprotein
MYPFVRKTRLIFSFLFILGSCKVSEKITEPQLVTMPNQFFDNQNETEQPFVQWREYFTDSILVGYIDLALQRNLDLKTALQRVSMARANTSIAAGALLPSLQGVVSAGQQRFGEYTIDGVGNFDTNLSGNVPTEKRIPINIPDYYTGFQSSWEIDVWGKLRSRKKAEVARFFASEKAQQLIKTHLVADVARYYYNLLALDNKLEIIKENIELQQTAVELITIQKEAGRATELAVKQFVAQLLNTKSLEALLLQEIVEQENKLNLLLARFPQPIARGKSILSKALLKNIEAGLPSQMLVNRPDIMQAELRLVAARLDVRAARAAFLPSLNITAGVGLQSFNKSVLFVTPTSLAYSVLGGLTAPLFNRNLIKAEYKKASAAQLEAFYLYQQKILNGFQEVSTQLSQINNLQASYEFKLQEVNTLTEGVATANDLFVAGLATYLEVVTAQKSVLEAELTAVETKLFQFYAAVDLYRALGGGW